MGTIANIGGRKNPNICSYVGVWRNPNIGLTEKGSVCWSLLCMTSEKLGHKGGPTCSWCQKNVFFLRFLLWMCLCGNVEYIDR